MTMAKKASIEGMFFAMIVLAWALLTIVFNVLNHQMPAQSPGNAPAQKPAVGTQPAPVARATQTAQAVSVR
jgi:hypothetical protein